MTRPLRVMVIDDEDDIREVARLSLQMDPAIEVRDFAAAAPALAVLGSGEWPPDIILLDVMMAGTDGLMALSQIRALPGHGDLPVVFMTARARASDHAALLAAGASAVITKPFAPLELAGTVRRLADAEAG